MYPERVTPYDSKSSDSILRCLNSGGTPSVAAGSCFTPIHPDNATKYDYTLGDVYQPVASSDASSPFPTVDLPLKVYAGREWPNEVNVPAVSTVINCVSARSNLPFRFAFLRIGPGPCIFDWEYNVEVCSKDGKAIQNADYRNSKLVVLPETAIWKGSTCPTK